MDHDRHPRPTHVLRTARLAVWCVLLPALHCSACADSSTTAEVPLDVVHSDLVDDMWLDDDDELACYRNSSPYSGDRDGDLLADYLEDANLNCAFDPGETDLTNPDSDFDGRMDGEEDANRNGRVDDCETDPRVADSESGLPAECTPDPVSLFCESMLMPQLSSVRAADAGVLAVPEGFVAERVGNTTHWTAFSNDQLFGFVVTLPFDAEAAETAMSRVLVRWYGEEGLPFIVESARLLRTTAYDSQIPALHLPSHLAYRVLLRLPLGAPIDLGSLRDQLALSASELTLASTARAGTLCANATVWATLIHREEEPDVMLAVVACIDDPLAEDNRFLLEDLTNTSQLVLGPMNPRGARCESLVPKHYVEPKLDLLWVIDNSASMADDLDRVVGHAERFLQTLSYSSVDWRVAVTTTEMWALDQAVPGVDIGHDPWLDRATGLRGDGFLSPGADPVAIEETFVSLVVDDPGCASTAATVGRNLCGSDYESGLRSALAVLRRTAQDPRPAFARRPDALTLVVIVSDEEDQAFKDDPTDSLETAQIPWAADDPRREDSVLRSQVVQPFTDEGVMLLAVVGDPGVGNGGVCEPFDLATGAGAEHGLGTIEVVHATGGGWGSICNDDLAVFSSMFTCAGWCAPAPWPGYPLADWPLSETIVVGVDGRLLPRSRTLGWDYDYESNGLLFFGAQFSADSFIDVMYRVWEPADG